MRVFAGGRRRRGCVRCVQGQEDFVAVPVVRFLVLPDEEQEEDARCLSELV